MKQRSSHVFFPTRLHKSCVISNVGQFILGQTSPIAKRIGFMPLKHETYSVNLYFLVGVHQANFPNPSDSFRTRKKRSPDRGIHVIQFFLPKVNGDFTRILISPGAVTRSSRSLIAVATGFTLFTPICPLSVVFRRTWTRQAVPNSSRIVDLVVGKRKMSYTHVTFPKSGLEVCKTNGRKQTER